MTEEQIKEEENKKFIEELKAKYGKITTVIIPYNDGDNEFTFYFKKADKITRKMIAKLSEGEVPERAVIAGFKALRVAGNEVAELENCPDDDAMVCAEDALIRFLRVQKATIKKN